MHHQKTLRVFFFAILIFSITFLANPSEKIIASPSVVPVLTHIWTTGDFSDKYTLANILVEDINLDGENEILSCNSSSPFALKNKPAGGYEVIWFDEMIDCVNIVTADANGDQIPEIYVATKSGYIIIYDGATFAKQHEIYLNSGINDITVAEVDNDGDLEIVTTGWPATLVVDAKTFAVEWRAEWTGGKEVAVGNIDNEPMPEIILNDESTAHILDASTKAEEWVWSGGFGHHLDLGDVDGDSRQEIVSIQDYVFISVFDADSRTIKWQSQIQEFMPNQLVLNVVDMTGDGLADIIAGDTTYASGYLGTNGSVLWSILNTGYMFSGIAAGDTDNDGAKEIIWRTGIQAYAPQTTFHIGNPQNKITEWSSTNIDGPLMVAAGDIDNDSEIEILMATKTTKDGNDGGLVRVFSAASHEIEWENNPLRTYFEISQMKLGQLDTDPALEILLAGEKTSRTQIVIFDGMTHAEERVYAPIEAYDPPVDVLLSDLDNDDQEEIIAGLSTQEVIVLNSATFATNWQSGTLNGPVLDLSVGDLDGNGVKDLAILTTQGVYLYDTATWSKIYQVALTGYQDIAILPAGPFSNGEILLVQTNLFGYKTLLSWNQATGSARWQKSLDKAVINDLQVLDIDTDGTQEFILLGNTGEETDNTSMLWAGVYQSDVNWKLQMSGKWGSLNSLATGDINQDGGMQLFFGSENLILENRMGPAVADKKIYLPLVNGKNTTCHVYGTVTEKASPAIDMILGLRLWDGEIWQEIDTTTTDQSGKYCFANLTSLAEGLKYQVRFFNHENTPSTERLMFWYTRELTSYQNGDLVNIGDFDLANTKLIDPDYGSDITLPYIFIWDVRDYPTTDVYELFIHDRTTNVLFRGLTTGPGIDYYTLNDLPPGFNLNDELAWAVIPRSPDGGWGFSYGNNIITITGVNP